MLRSPRKNGMEAHQLFPDEGHGSSKKINEIRANKAILAFLDKYLKENQTTLGVVE